MCGIVGIVGKSNVNQALYDALTVLQHRGQDAAGIVEWNRRLKLITKWSEKSFNDDEAYSADELRELVRQTKVRWAITRTRVRYDVPESDLLYSNDTYKILRLPQAE